MLNTFAAKWTSWAIEIKWVMRVFNRTKSGDVRGKGRSQRFSMGWAVETINKCEIDPDRGGRSWSEMELLNFWFLVNWADQLLPSLSLRVVPSLSVSLFQSGHLQTIHNTGQRWRSPGESASPPSSSSSAAAARSVVDSLFPSLSLPFYLRLFLPGIVLLCRTLAAVLHCFWSFVWRHSHLPLLPSSVYSIQKSMLCLHPSLSFVLFVQPLSWWFPYA